MGAKPLQVLLKLDEFGGTLKLSAEPPVPGFELPQASSRLLEGARGRAVPRGLGGPSRRSKAFPGMPLGRDLLRGALRTRLLHRCLLVDGVDDGRHSKNDTTHVDDVLNAHFLGQLRAQALSFLGDVQTLQLEPTRGQPSRHHQGHSLGRAAVWRQLRERRVAVTCGDDDSPFEDHHRAVPRARGHLEAVHVPALFLPEVALAAAADET
mmetsp:Transcript_28819/g.95777  ORF Transcript_28819/g.95777 Transcript_28819/m.95777 type:complete len:209 (-) Transcript_28819:1084-1710(-)